MTHETFETRQSLLLLLKGVNNEGAWSSFVARYTPLIEKWCRQADLPPSTLDEVKSRVLTILVRQLKTFEYDPSKSFRAWLKTVVQNTQRTLWREKRRRPGDHASGGDEMQEMLQELPDAMSDLGNELEERLADDLQKAETVSARVRERVKPHTWESFWRVSIQGARPTDVAADLGLKIAQVSMYNKRVLKMLREEGEKFLTSNPA